MLVNTPMGLLCSHPGSTLVLAAPGVGCGAGGSAGTLKPVHDDHSPAGFRLGPAWIHWARLTEPTRPSPSAERSSALEPGAPATATVSAYRAGGRPNLPLDQPVALSEVDQRRAGELTGHRRLAFLTGRRLLAQALAQEFGSGVVTTAACQHCGEPHAGIRIDGAPGVANLSYAGDLVVAALAPRSRAVELGVDVARTNTDPVRDHDLARLLAVDPTEALLCWTQVEAVLKATGQGLRLEPDRVQLRAGSATLAGTGRQYRLATTQLMTGELITVAWRAAG